MGLSKGMVVQELGWDADVDDDLRNDIMDAIDADLVEEALEAVDMVLLWWREEDGDVTDGLVDSMTDLSSAGVICSALAWNAASSRSAARSAFACFNRSNKPIG